MMGRMVKWNKERGWQIAPTPFVYRILGLEQFKRYTFAGSKAWYNRRRNPIRKLVKP
jgi:hypothetical protein